MKKHLYDIFADKWYHGGTIYFYSDPHFSDLESYRFRGLVKESLNKDDSNYSMANDAFYKIQCDILDQMQIDNINKVCGKNDTLVILGDVGNIECLKKLKAGYKVLITGNHDKGASNYKRGINVTNKSNIWYAIKTKEEFENLPPIEYEFEDNHLFDEVYEGTLQISPKIILSHEPCNYNYCLNIHGHVHSQKEFTAYCEEVIDGQLDGSEIKRNVYSLNVCAELLNYKPISLKEIVDKGLIKDVADIHRETIYKRNEELIKNEKI